MKRQIILVSDDVNFLRQLTSLGWDPTDEVVAIPFEQAVREIGRFELGQRNLVLVDWQPNVRRRRWRLCLTAFGSLEKHMQP